MSGVEFVVSTVLAGVPLAIIMLEKWAVFAKGVSTFRNRKGALRIPVNRVDTQKSIFRYTVINLLSAITDNHDLITSTISELAQSARDSSQSSDITQQPTVQMSQELKMSSIFHNRIDALKESFESCRCMVELVVTTLETLIKKLSEIVGPDQRSASESSRSRTREWLLRTRSGIRLALRETGLEKDIDRLCILNKELETITKHIISGLNEVKHAKTRQGANTALKRAASSVNKLEKYRQIRDASDALYETLANTWTCDMPDHGSHAAKVCCVDIPETTPALNSVKLRLALTVYETSEELNPHTMDPLWLEVEHCESTSSTSQSPEPVAVPAARPGPLGNLEAVLVKSAEPLTADTPTSRTAKTVRFDTFYPSSPQPSGSTTSGSSSNNDNNNNNNNNNNNDNSPQFSQSQDDEVEIDLVNLTLATDICNHFYLEYSKCQPQECLGYLEGQYLQRFYRPLDRGLTKHPMLLSSIISWVDRNTFLKVLPYPAAFHIASSLATSVLQFHSTKWLPETWRSEDVTFFSVEELSAEKELQLSYPYFKIAFAKRKQNDKGKGKAIDVQHPTTSQLQVSCQVTGARNDLLFRLGIVLIEVGFSSSWQDLVESERFDLPPNQQTEYHIAERLCKVLLPRKMGPEYTRIVKKCIGCDFKLSEPEIDFTRSEELQTAFLIDVVDKLRGMKEGTEAPGGGANTSCLS